jgi:D-arabinose 1-dehydrogenase-like Zn-dependent alcohol dehydrogenase
MAKMRAVQVSRAKGPFEFVEREIPEPPAGWVRVRVEACGICHSDSFTKEGTWPGVSYPRIPGHEIAGRIDAIGSGVRPWLVGQRAGIGWFGGNCGWCEPCRRGLLVNCRNTNIPGITIDGGYAEYVIVPASALALMPDELNSVDAAPLLCAGITTFNALRNSGARAGDLVAILGIGGLGHLGVQFAARMGFNTVALARGKDKEELARQLGARHYIDTEAQDPAKELAALGGAKVVLATVTNGKAMGATLGGLGLDGKLVILGGAFDPMEVPPARLIGERHTITGWPSGASIDSEDTLRFAAAAGVHSMNEVFPLERVEEAYDRMMSGRARFRVVLTATHS